MTDLVALAREFVEESARETGHLGVAGAVVHLESDGGELSLGLDHVVEDEMGEDEHARLLHAPILVLQSVVQVLLVLLHLQIKGSSQECWKAQESGFWVAFAVVAIGDVVGVPGWGIGCRGPRRR